MEKFIPITKVSVTTDQFEKYDATLKFMYDIGWIERPVEEKKVKKMTKKVC